MAEVEMVTSSIYWIILESYNSSAEPGQSLKPRTPPSSIWVGGTEVCGTSTASGGDSSSLVGSRVVRIWAQCSARESRCPTLWLNCCATVLLPFVIFTWVKNWHTIEISCTFFLIWECNIHVLDLLMEKCNWSLISQYWEFVEVLFSKFSY